MRTEAVGKLTQAEESFLRKKGATWREQEDRRVVGFFVRRGRRDSVSRMARSHDRHTLCSVCMCAHTGARGMRGKDGGDDDDDDEEEEEMEEKKEMVAGKGHRFIIGEACRG